MSAASARPAVFLDRDGTITDESEWLVDPAKIVVLPGAAGAIARLNAAGWPVVVVTNQSALARGWIDAATLARIHARLDEILARSGARVDAYYHCPHHPTEGVGALRVECRCRKPAPGLLLDAARERGLDLARSWTIGDAERDLRAGASAGTRTILVATGKGAAEAERMRAAGRAIDAFVPDLSAAVDVVLRASSASPQGR